MPDKSKRRPKRSNNNPNARNGNFRAYGGRVCSWVGLDRTEMVPAMIGVGLAQVVIAAMFVLFTSFLGLGRARQRVEAARPDAGAGTTAEASAAKSQARLGLVGTIITTIITGVFGLIGAVIQGLIGSGGSGG
jgi:hypothetical protein